MQQDQYGHEHKLLCSTVIDLKGWWLLFGSEAVGCHGRFTSDVKKKLLICLLMVRLPVITQQ